MKRVPGIGGIFFKSENPEELYPWYEKHLGIEREAHGQGARHSSGASCGTVRATNRAEGADRVVDLSSRHEVFCRQLSGFDGELPRRRS
jgi:hypothetical protein